mmetsp:Transcript_70467/g.229113  ORF Transcript_70467/g.229113 Transcript_70467/m.229113 type:complete len:200 (+) Transcript_70467:485-1084(+)
MVELAREPELANASADEERARLLSDAPREALRSHEGLGMVPLASLPVLALPSAHEVATRWDAWSQGQLLAVQALRPQLCPLRYRDLVDLLRLGGLLHLRLQLQLHLRHDLGLRLRLAQRLRLTLRYGLGLSDRLGLQHQRVLGLRQSVRLSLRLLLRLGLEGVPHLLLRLLRELRRRVGRLLRGQPHRGLAGLSAHGTR